MRVPDQRHLWLGNGHRGRCALTRTVNARHARRAFLQPTRAHVHAIAHLKLSAMAGCLSVKTAGHEVRANQAASVRRHFLRVGDERRWIRCPEIELRGRIASAVRAFLCNDGMGDSHGDMPARASAVVQVLSPTGNSGRRAFFRKEVFFSPTKLLCYYHLNVLLAYWEKRETGLC